MSQIILTGEDAVRFAQRFFNPSLEQLQANEEALERAMDGITIVDADGGFDAIIDGIAEPWKGEEERKGHWIDDGFYADGYPHHVFRCSECDSSRLGVSRYGLPKVCPNCDAEMKEENKCQDQ